MTTITLYKSIRYFAIFGVFLASYLLYLYFARPTTSLCYINAKINCDLVTKGEISTLFGIPVGAYGLMGFILMCYGTIIKNKKLILGMATFGMLFCARMLYYELFVYYAYCPVCLMCMFTMTSTFVLGLILSKKKVS